MLKELNSRGLGGGAKVLLYLDDENESLMVAVHGTKGSDPVAVLKGLTPEQALDAYRHPFARRAVPDIFSVKVPKVQGYKDGYTYPENPGVCASCRNPMWRNPHTCQDGPQPGTSEGFAT